MKTKKHITRRDLIKQFGFSAFMLAPVLRSMDLMAATPYTTAPRFVMFFKGGAFLPQNPASLAALAGTPLAALSEHASDVVLFKNMHIHGGGVRSDGYQEEHAAGLYGCMTGNSIHYSKSDSYFAYTDHESIDMRIARQYQTIEALKSLPFASLHIGAGAHSDSDSTGLGIRYISYRARQAGDSLYGNCVEPIQDVGQVYKSLMDRINLICAKTTGTPNAGNDELLKSLNQKASLVDFQLQRLKDATRKFGLDSEHSQKLQGLVQGLSEVEKLTKAQIAAAQSGGGTGSKTCPVATNPTGNGNNKKNLDELSPIHDNMIALIKLAFEWDLTRVVAFSLSGAASGATWPSQGINTYHHALEHANDTAGLNKMGTYYSGKFAKLLTAMKTVTDEDGKTALYNSSVILGMECNGANGHTTKNIPFVYAGQAGGKYQTGRIIDAAGRSNNDLLVSVAQAAGIEGNTFGLADLCKGPILKS